MRGTSIHIISQPDLTVHLYQVKSEGARTQEIRTLHRILLLPLMSVTDMEDDVKETFKDFQADTQDSSSTNDTARYVIPMRRPPESTSLSPPKERPSLNLVKPNR